MAEETVTLCDVFELPKNGKPDLQPARWEAVQERIKQEVKERVYQAAFVFLVIFAAVVIFNDVSKTFPWSHMKQ